MRVFPRINGSSPDATLSVLDCSTTSGGAAARRIGNGRLATLAESLVPPGSRRLGVDFGMFRRLLKLGRPAAASCRPSTDTVPSDCTEERLLLGRIGRLGFHPPLRIPALRDALWEGLTLGTGDEASIRLRFTLVADAFANEGITDINLAMQVLRRFGTLDLCKPLKSGEDLVTRQAWNVALRLLHSPDAFEALQALLNPARKPSTDSDRTETELLSAEIARALARRGVVDIEPAHEAVADASQPEAGLRRALVAQALAQAGVRNIAEVTPVLCRLGTLDFCAPLAIDSDRVTQQAWRVATTLERSADGFAALQALLAAAPEPSVAARRPEVVNRVLLQTAAVLAPADAYTTYSNSSRPWSAHRAIERRVASQRQFAQLAFEAARKWATPGSELTREQKGVLYAWRMGLRDEREVSRMGKYLHKFTKRAATADRERRLLEVPKAAAGVGKNPFYGLRLNTAPDDNAKRTCLPVVAHDHDYVWKTLRKFAETGERGKALKLSDGGRLTFSTEKLAIGTAIAAAFGGIPVSAIPDLRGSRGRHAQVDMEFHEHGFRLFGGKLKTTSVHAGLRGFVGYPLPLVATLGTSLNGWGAREWGDRYGFTSQVARRPNPDGCGYDDEATKHNTVELFRFLSTINTEATAQAAFESIAERYFEDPDVSFGWIDERPASRRFGASATGVASLKPPGSPTGFSGYASLRGEDTSERSRSDMRSENRQSQQFRWSGRQVAELTVSAGLTFSSELDADPKVSGSVSAPEVSKKWTLLERGTSLSSKLGREYGKLVRNRCEIELKFSDAKLYAKAIGNIREELNALPDGDARNVAMESLEKHQKHLEEGLEQRKEHQKRANGKEHPDRIYALRLRPREDALTRVNALQAFAAQAQGEHHVQAWQEANAKCDAILGDAGSWSYADVIIRERRETPDDRSLARIWMDVLGDVGASTTLINEREVLSDSIPLEVISARALPHQ